MERLYLQHRMSGLLLSIRSFAVSSFFSSSSVLILFCCVVVGRKLEGTNLILFCDFAGFTCLDWYLGTTDCQMSVCRHTTQHVYQNLCLEKDRSLRQNYSHSEFFIK